MLNRRDLCTGLGIGLGAGAMADSLVGKALAAETILPLYGSLGPELVHYALDVTGAHVHVKDTVMLPASLQYAWPHPSQRFLYVASSNFKPGSHYAIAYRVNADGSLLEHGAAIPLPARPIHCCTDNSGAYLLIAFNIPSQVRIFAINTNGTIGAEIAQDPTLDFGTYAHQVRVTPSGKSVTVCSRGNDASRDRPEDPGYIEVFGFDQGRLSPLQRLAPGGNGIGFGPRHLDFSPDGRFVYVSVERENQLYVYGMDPAGRLSGAPLFIKNTLSDPDGKKKHPGQGAGAIHVAPDGRFVYQTNRGSGTMEQNGKRVWNGGENDVLAWAINPRTGEPTLIQRAPAHAFELRTFTITPTGTILVAASTTPLDVADADGIIRTVSAGLSLYRITADGRLSFVRKHDVDTGSGTQLWCGLLTMS
jgi:6-phosphogluconolactonase (cycloisomerase 2 family)